jgi:glycerol kinase
MSDRGDLILAIDQGTTGSTCLVVRVSPSGLSIIGRGYDEVPQHFPKPGWVEHDLDEIWRSVERATVQALGAPGVSARDIAAIGITNQRETTGLWDMHGRPLHRAIVWQDRRTADRCAALKKRGHEKLVRKRTGLVLDPYFSGTKLAWLLDELAARPRAKAGELRFGTIDTWLVHKLTGGAVHITDATNASRTLLYDIARGAWDDDLLELVGKIPRSLLPEVAPSSAVYGKTRGLSFLPDGIPIAGMAGDQQAALFGQACFSPGMAKCTYGTGAFALVNIGNKPIIQSKRGLVTTVAWRLGTKTTYALEGSTFVAGAIVQWLRDGLGFFSSSSEIEALAASVPDSGGVTLVPALTGLGAPHWRPEARGLISGLTRGTTRAHIARAALEGIGLQIADLLGAMRVDSGKAVRVLRVDGGASANNLLMQYQADVLATEIHRPHVLETTAFGAACLAGLGVGLFSDLEAVSRAWKLERSFEPTMPKKLVREHQTRWAAAVSKA